MTKYTINYNNGFLQEIFGTLEEAKEAAQQGFSYTQTNVSIHDEDNQMIAQSTWYGVVPTELDYENDDVLEIIADGFYSSWKELF